jgi:hypothetical protein
MALTSSSRKMELFRLESLNERIVEVRPDTRTFSLAQATMTSSVTDVMPWESARVVSTLRVYMRMS